jgi:glucose-6-phosphate isomerase
LWNINSFDQWGVELGKVLAKNVKNVLVKNPEATNQVDFTGFNANSATKNLISRYREYQK